jgi:hypothetical protein
MDIRDEIRNILMEVFAEAAPSIHFKDRVHTRLTSSLYTRPEFNYGDIRAELALLKRVNFNPDESYAVQLKTLSTTFTSKDPETGSESIGNEIWATIRGNSITTVFFRNSSQKHIPVSNIDNTLRFKSLYKYYQSAEKNSDGTIDFVEKSKGHKQGKGQRKKVNLDFPIVDLGKGGKWYVDESSEELIYAKNIKKKLSFDDLKEEVLEKVIDAVTIPSTV